MMYKAHTSPIVLKMEYNNKAYITGKNLLIFLLQNCYHEDWENKFVRVFVK